MENLTDDELMFLDKLLSISNIRNEFRDFTAEQLFDPEISIDFP